MSDLKFEVDVEGISSSFGDLKEQIKKDLTDGVQALASMTHAKTMELARDELNSLSQMYMDNVEFDNPEENLWIVTLKNPALWIEEGRKCIVYGKNISHIPKILTPDGEIPITKAKVGMLVLNQHGKWTEITDIYDEHLVEKSKLEVFEIKACRYEPNNKKLHKRVYSLGFQTKCKVCGERKKYRKLKNKERANKYCGSCLSKQEVYRVKVGGSLNSHDANWTTMYLTGDHKVMTQNGWKEIRNFTRDDCVIIPLIKNHSGEIQMLPLKAFRIKLKKMSPFSPINRRWDITVKEGQSFICNKILIHNSGFMQELLDGKSSKVSKDGSRYAVIPFKHNKNPSQQSVKAQELANQIKQAMKSKKINFRKLELGKDGSPRIGKLHSFNVESARIKESHKDPATYGVNVYQTKQKDGSVRRDVMTFRVISEKHRSEGKWVHPGREGSKLMDKALEWAMSTWDREVLPSILKEYS